MSISSTNWSTRLQCSGAGGTVPQDFVFGSTASDQGPGTDSKEEVVVVQAFVGEASESFDDTGTVLWPAAPLLCYFLLSDAGRRLVQGMSVLELGAGVGIPGLIAGRVCKSLVLTDHNDQVVERLGKNVRLNRASLLASCQAVSVERLDWREFFCAVPRLRAAESRQGRYVSVCSNTVSGPPGRRRCVLSRSG